MLEALNVIMERAVDRGVFKGVSLPNGGPSISHLFYADDIVFIGEWSEENVLNLNRILRCFFLCSGLKVNLDKSTLFGAGVSEEHVVNMVSSIRCKAGEFPFDFLGIPVGSNMKRIKFWKPIVDKFNVKLSGWKAKSLSKAGRVTLAKAVLGALPIYFLSLFKAPLGVIKELEKIRKNFVWGLKNGKRNIKWIDWGKMVRPKRLGGLGIGDIRNLNLALLSKWWWKFKDNKGALWVRVVEAIHKVKNSFLSFPLNRRVAGIWKDIRGIEKDFSALGMSLLKNLKGVAGSGDKICFWLVNWVGSGLLKDRFKCLFKVAQNKEAKIMDFMDGAGQFSWLGVWARNLQQGMEMDAFVQLINLVNNYNLHNGPDYWVWDNSNNDSLRVSKVRNLLFDAAKKDNDFLWPFWNNWVPPKINIFGWRACLNKIPVKFSLAKRGVFISKPFMF
ncbi:putative RNA-directed DNA polymerase [Helianthus annuus]|nr:putative RNA-directed DNA polymerase [Helianthus annuus]